MTDPEDIGQRGGPASTTAHADAPAEAGVEKPPHRAVWAPPETFSRHNKEWTDAVFAKVTDLITGARFSPAITGAVSEKYALKDKTVVNELQDIYRWLIRQVKVKEDEITELKEHLKQHEGHIADSFIPPELMDAANATFDRIESITGKPVPLSMRTLHNFLISSALLNRTYLRDPLTGLLSQHRIREIIEELVETRDKDEKTKNQDPVTVIKCDMDKFKWYNSMLGEERTDLVLKKVAMILREEADKFVDEEIVAGLEGKARAKTCEEHLPIARRSGDSFVFVMRCDKATAEKRMAEITKQLAKKVMTFRDENRDPIMKVRNIRMTYGCHQIGEPLNAENQMRDPLSGILTEADAQMEKAKQEKEARWEAAEKKAADTGAAYTKASDIYKQRTEGDHYQRYAADQAHDRTEVENKEKAMKAAEAARNKLRKELFPIFDPLRAITEEEIAAVLSTPDETAAIRPEDEIDMGISKASMPVEFSKNRTRKPSSGDIAMP